LKVTLGEAESMTQNRLRRFHFCQLVRSQMLFVSAGQ
jgi:hypothetical protein